MQNDIMPTMSNVISLDEYRPHLSGEFLCIGCGHEWSGVAPVGLTEFECPSCHTFKAVTIGLCAPEKVWECNCGNQLFYLNEYEMAVCAKCGVTHE